MKKKIRIKVSNAFSLMKLMEALSGISANIDAEGAGCALDIYIYGDGEEVKSTIRKIREIARRL